MLLFAWKYSPRPYLWGPNEHTVDYHNQYSVVGETLSPLRFSFCEEKYHVHPQFAEFANTLTNLLYITLAIRGTCRNRSSWLLYLTLALVGFASSWNHMTLRLDAQTVDQLSMHFLSATLFYYSTITILPTIKRASRVSPRHILALAVLVFEFVVAFCFLTSHKAGIHQLSFAFMCVASAGILLYRTIRLKSTATKSKLRKLQAIGTLSIVIGYVLWSLDFALCRTLRTWRQDFGLPYGLLLEFHGWWHILTAMSGACYIEMVEGLRREEEKTRQLELPTWTAAGTSELVSEKEWVHSTGGFCWVGRK